MSVWVCILVFWLKLLLLALAGAAGTLSRYGLVTVVASYFNIQSPWNIWLVNLMGCGLFGFIAALSQPPEIIPPESRFVLLVGFVAAFTTFSTQVFDAYESFQKGAWTMGLVHLFLQPAIGLGALIVGQQLGFIVKQLLNSNY
jgi:fluoride exporter